MTISDKHVWYGKTKKMAQFLLCRGYLYWTTNQKLLDMFFSLRFIQLLLVFLVHNFPNIDQKHHKELCNEKCIATAIYLRLIVRHDYTYNTYVCMNREIRSLSISLNTITYTWWHTTMILTPIYFAVIFIKWPFS